jgi:membrane protein DedA with SNARE-associated domain
MSFAADIVSSKAVYGPLLYLSLYVGTFLHEGTAIAFGAACLVAQRSSVVLTATVLIAGIITGDLGIYGLGALARRSKWLQRRLGVGTRDGIQPKTRHGLLPVVAMCRVVPGMLFPTFLSYGWRGVPFGHFAMASTVVTLLYVPVLLTLFVQFGLQIAQWVQHSPMVSLIAPAIGVTVFGSWWLIAHRRRRLAALQAVVPAA